MARNQLQTLTSASGSPAETLVRLRAAQAGYCRFGLLLQVHVPPQALRGIAEFGPTFNTDLADRLRGLCTPALATPPQARAPRQLREQGLLDAEGPRVSASRDVRYSLGIDP